MPVTPQQFIVNLHLVCCFWFALGVAVVLLVAGITLAKWMLWRRRQREAREEYHRQTHGPDGRPYPPSGRGLCDRCHRPSNRVFFLPGGKRLCIDCYAETLNPPATPPPGAPHA